MGDIDQQTVAGAISTGTHGTGGQRSSLSAQVSGLELVTGKGELLQANAEENPEVLDVARLGLGALGILTAVTFDVEPMFTLEAHEAPMLWDEALDRFEELVTENQHFEMFWFPHTERLLTKRNNRTLDPAEPLSRAQALARRRVPREPGLRLGQPRGQPPPRAGTADQRPVRPGTRRAPLLRRAAPGVHLDPHGGLPRDGVRRAARGGGGGPARGARDHRGPATGRSASRSRSAPARETRRRCRRRTSATRCSSPST